MTFEKSMVRRVFGFLRDEVIRDWRHFCNRELQDLYSSSDIKMKVKEQRTHKEEMRVTFRVYLESQKERFYFAGVGIDGSIV
jgi:predicted alpha/beta hydrolase